MFKKFTWAHGIILALGSFIAFILFMIFIFPTGQKNSELVTNDYYEDELQYQKVIDAKNNATSLPQLPEYKQTAEGITIAFPQNVKPDGNKVDFHLYRTEDSNLDVKNSVTVDGSNSIKIPKKVIFPGSYTLKINWKEKDKPFQVDYDLLWK